MEYHGKLYGKVGRRLIPLSLTSEHVDALLADNEEMKLRIISLEGELGHTVPTGIDLPEVAKNVIAATLSETNRRLLAGCEQAEKLINAGGYTKWQDGAWWIFWESSGEVAAGPAKSLYDLALILSNVPRQISLAGGAGGSHSSGAKALGLLFCQQALCLSGGTSNWCSSKLPTGQRLTARACSHISFRGPGTRGMSLALVPISARSIPASSCWNILVSGGRWQAQGRENRKSFHAAPLEYCCCGRWLLLT